MDYDNICQICFGDFNDHTISLNCNHKFHINCVKLSILNKPYKEQVCPYCRTKVDLRTLNKLNRCQAILKSGKNKGYQCSYTSKFGSYCGRHKMIDINKNVDSSINLKL